MSYATWHNYGIGINSDMLTTTADKLRELITLAPEYEAKLKDYCKIIQTDEEFEYETANYDQLLCLTDSVESDAVSIILREVIKEKENIYLANCSDFEGECFLIFQPLFPWEMTKEERALTQDSLKDLFEKYISMITDQRLEDLDYGYKEIENGG